ncbi:MAG: hypothetical protein A3K59_05910 [Euryarchaeota archaeon RBG_19FT_COMBO_69_17]|nr:MAG: hypothetical protein A3K59_05910 [Euryarchaeota archaeon RBG_19FT_COMBO_69_17]
MDLIVALLLIFVSAKLAGEAFERMRQSPMIGEVLAGIVLGPALLVLVNPDPATDLGASLRIVADLGVLVLVLLAGMELGREGLSRAFHERSFVVAVVEFVFPFALGLLLAQAMGLSFVQSVFLGTAMAVTALPVSVRILMDLNLLHSRLGRAIVSVALVNDLVAFAMLGLVIALGQAGSASPDPGVLGWILGKTLLFVGLVFSVEMVLRRTMQADGNGDSRIRRFIRSMKGQESAFAFGIAIALLLGAAAEAAGIHFAVGVFYGGILITPKMVGREEFNRIRNSVSAVTLGLLAPIFFAFVGLNVALNFESWPLILLVTGVAFAGKFLGGLIGGAAAGFRGAPLLALGVGLNARGMMELLLAQVGLATGIIGPDIYSALIVMTLVTTLTAPPLMKRLLRRFKVEDVLPSTEHLEASVPAPKAMASSEGRQRP